MKAGQTSFEVGTKIRVLSVASGDPDEAVGVVDSEGELTHPFGDSPGSVLGVWVTQRGSTPPGVTYPGNRISLRAGDRFQVVSGPQNGIRMMVPRLPIVPSSRVFFSTRLELTVLFENDGQDISWVDTAKAAFDDVGKRRLVDVKVTRVEQVDAKEMARRLYDVGSSADLFELTDDGEDLAE